MSRQPSPGPSHGQFYASVGPTPTTSVRQKSKAYSSGIAAGAEDVKYAAKYKDLKRKVKEIETDNDKLLFKVMQAKRNIQRAKLERAILYERLAAIPASPPPNRPNLPPQHPHRAQPHQAHSVPHGHKPQSVPHAVTIVETRNGPVQVVAGPDGRPVVDADGNLVPAQAVPMGPGVAPHAPVQIPVQGHHPRHGHHLRSDVSHAQQMHEVHSSSRSRSHSTQPQAQLPPLPNFERERDWDRDKERHHHGHPYPPGLPMSDGPTAERDRDRERSRRHDVHELASSQTSQHSHSPTSPTDGRYSQRVHHHQRIAPGTNVNPSGERPFVHPNDAPLESENGNISPPVAPSGRHERERDGASEHRTPLGVSRGTSSSGPSRPDSRTQERVTRERRRSVGSRLSDIVNADPGDDHSSPDASRKRAHGDMDVDGGAYAMASNGQGGHGPPPASAGYEVDDRGPKRLHADRGMSPVGPLTQGGHETESRHSQQQQELLLQKQQKLVREAHEDRGSGESGAGSASPPQS